MAKQDIFIKAAQLMFPGLRSDDSRIIEVANYAREQYYSYIPVDLNNYRSMKGSNKTVKQKKQCILCAMEYSEFETYTRFYKLCQNLGIDPMRKEVIISRGKLFYTNDFGYVPELVDVTF